MEVVVWLLKNCWIRYLEVQQQVTAWTLDLSTVTLKLCISYHFSENNFIPAELNHLDNSTYSFVVDFQLKHHNTAENIIHCFISTSSYKPLDQIEEKSCPGYADHNLTRS